LKLEGSGYGVEQIITAAVENAKEARRGSINQNAYIAQNVGPIGELLEPMGTLSFSEAYDLFVEQITLGVT
jgi:5-methyltetrahydrofolate--homocysteine methyltransferase